MTRQFNVILEKDFGKELLSVLKKAGFELPRVKGSHHFLRHHDGRSTVVPVHSGETIGPGCSPRFFVTVT